jgi:hypothetical protein
VKPLDPTPYDRAIGAAALLASAVPTFARTALALRAAHSLCHYYSDELFSEDAIEALDGKLREQRCLRFLQLAGLTNLALRKMLVARGPSYAESLFNYLRRLQRAYDAVLDSGELRSGRRVVDARTAWESCAELLDEIIRDTERRNIAVCRRLSSVVVERRFRRHGLSRRRSRVRVPSLATSRSRLGRPGPSALGRTAVRWRILKTGCTLAPARSRRVRGRTVSAP